MPKKSKETEAQYSRSIFIFRRDLRLDDNTGLIEALKSSDEVVPCFVFDIDQIDPKRNEYFTNNQVQFMIESLKDLDEQLSEYDSRLFFFHGEKEKTFQHMLKEIKPDAVFVNEDYTAYSKKRDGILEDLCQKNDVEFLSHSDYTILPLNEVTKSDGDVFKKFTPYYNQCLQHKVKKPQSNTFSNYIPADESFKGEYDYDDIDKFYKYNDKIEVHGGRKEALNILDQIEKWKDYKKNGDHPAYPTTKLSAYNKFGCASPREVFYAAQEEFGKNCELIRQLYWRDFYYAIANSAPHIFGDAYKDNYRNIYFHDDEEAYKRWCEGRTGCPIVDAAMRQLNTTGYMTNRLRLIVANYLVKDLLVDWRKGEKYFATQLVDYDASQNNGNWQWVASSGADAQPYFRIFNPMLQSEKYDKDCEYILEWVPELKDVKPHDIHHWEENYQDYEDIDYSKPIIRHDRQKKECLKMYKEGLYGEKVSDEDVETEKKGKIGEEEKLKGKEEKQMPNKKRRADEVDDEDTEAESDEGHQSKKVKKSKPLSGGRSKGKSKEKMQEEEAEEEIENEEGYGEDKATDGRKGGRRVKVDMGRKKLSDKSNKRKGSDEVEAMKREEEKRPGRHTRSGEKNEETGQRNLGGGKSKKKEYMEKGSESRGRRHVVSKVR